MTDRTESGLIYYYNTIYIYVAIAFNSFQNGWDTIANVVQFGA